MKKIDEIWKKKKKYFSLNERRVHCCVIYIYMCVCIAYPAGVISWWKTGPTKKLSKREKKISKNFTLIAPTVIVLLLFKVRFLTNRKLHSLLSLFYTLSFYFSFLFFLRRPKFAQLSSGSRSFNNRVTLILRYDYKKGDCSMHAESQFYRNYISEIMKWTSVIQTHTYVWSKSEKSRFQQFLTGRQMELTIFPFFFTEQTLKKFFAKFQLSFIPYDCAPNFYSAWDTRCVLSLVNEAEWNAEMEVYGRRAIRRELSIAIPQMKLSWNFRRMHVP